MSRTTILQPTGGAWAPAELAGGVIGLQSSKSKVQSSKEIRTAINPPEPFEPAYEVWRLEFGVWSFSSPGLSNQIFFDELLVQVDAQAGPVRDRDPSVFRLQFFMRQFVAHGRVVHAVLEEERIAARGEPMQARRDSDWAGVTMVAKTRSDFLDSRPDVGGVGETVPRNIHLVNVEGVTVDQRPERFAPALLFTCRNGHRRAIS